MTDRRRDLLSLATLCLAALILGHHLVFLTTYGPRYWAMLERTGHGPVWAITVVTIVILSGGLVFLAVRRLASLSRLARAVRRGELAVHNGRPQDLVIVAARMWFVIAAVSLALFVLNENLERAVNGLPAPGFTVLALRANHPSPILVFVAVAGAIALVAGLYRWRRDILIARVRAVRPAWDRSADGSLAEPTDPPSRRPRSLVGSRLAGRAPPLSIRLSTA